MSGVTRNFLEAGWLKQDHPLPSFTEHLLGGDSWITQLHPHHSISGPFREGWCPSGARLSPGSGDMRMNNVKYCPPGTHFRMGVKMHKQLIVKEDKWWEHTVLQGQGRGKAYSPTSPWPPVPSPLANRTFSPRSPFAKETVAAAFRCHIYFYRTEGFLLMTLTCAVLKWLEKSL